MSKVATQKMKAYVSSFVLRLGPISTAGRLVQIQVPKTKTSVSYHWATPEGKAVKQVYVDDDGNAYTTKELVKSLDSDEGIVVVDAEAIAESKKSDLAPNEIELTVHTAEEVERQLFPSDSNAYVFQPDTASPANKKWHDFIAASLDSSRSALVGMCNLKNYEGLYRVTLWRGQLVLQKQLFPAEINEHEVVKVPATSDEISRGLAVLEKLTQPFDAGEYRNTVFEKQKALADAAVPSASGTTAIKVVAKQAKDLDILAALDAMDF